MRILFIIFIISFFSLTTASGQTRIKSILILGDSYLKGHFGAFLQKNLHETGKYDVLSIAIGGAGSKTFLPPMKNSCCGYRVRQSCAGIELKKTKKITEVKFPILERSERLTNRVVMNLYEGDIFNIMDIWKPDAIILVLGANKINAHEELLEIISSHSANIPVIWIGPFNKKTSASRYLAIQKGLKNKTNTFLVKSDSIVSKMKITPAHFYGTTAKKLAGAIFKHFEPFLNAAIDNKKQ